MGYLLNRIGPERYSEYERIINSYRVEHWLRVDVIDGGLGGFRLVEEKAANPYLRDYNADGHDGPRAWSAEFDISQWGLFLAADTDGTPAGGAAVAPPGAGLLPMDVMQPKDLAVLWDIRVDPHHRGKGLGRRLFLHAAAWAHSQGWGQMGVETDNTNLPACRFYASLGCQLGAIHRFGYRGVPAVADHVMLLWYFDLD